MRRHKKVKLIYDFIYNLGLGVSVGGAI